MAIPKVEPPWNFLLSASKTTLQSYELSRLSHAANLRKEIGQLLDSYLEENSAAMLARWLMENRERGAGSAEKAHAAEARPAGASRSARTASNNFLADPALPEPGARGTP